ncbi:MAG: lipopolysaccharide heptosyltransferase I [Candidatus Aminicenantes bacterium]|nr:lipopolysaccharide heptosyltransferase I [Candidatus Aminicenantes bacterium]
MLAHNIISESDEIIIIKLSSLGDVIHTLPSFSVLRQQFPEKTMTWVIGDKAKPILDLVPGLDRIVVCDFQNKSLLSGSFWSSFFELKSEIKNRKSISLDFQGLIKSGWISYLSKAKKRIGFHRTNLKEPSASLFYTDHLEPVSEYRHVIKKNLQLLTLLGIRQQNIQFPLDLSPALIRSTLEKLLQKGIPINQNAVVFNVGGAWQTKRWESENWTALINSLTLTSFVPVILWGNQKEKQVADEISQNTGVMAAPFLSVKEVFALIHESILVVSSDSFPLQAACALSVPVVGLFGPTNPIRNGPFSAKDKTVFHQLDCSYCYKRKCRTLECMKQITPQEVAHLCKEWLV